MAIIADGSSAPNGHSPESVPLGTGPPTREELLVYYPAKFTWQQLRTFVNSGDLGLLKRDKKLQQRYAKWANGIKEQYGSMVNYLLAYRLQWGQADNLSKLPSRLDLSDYLGESSVDSSVPAGVALVGLPQIPANSVGYFTADIPRHLVSIIRNDWPYSVPANIEHSLIWTVLPILPLELPPSVKPRLLQDGLWGFTGNSPDSPPPSPSLLPSYLPALAEWGVTEASLVRSARGTDEEEEAVRRAGLEVHKFVSARWKESEWETAWFVNPPRLQSVPGLAHIHVFARFKSPEERAAWAA
ncbi:hypothetical protein BV25DRAFT_1906838 [Artomyces pyxidatus]|uniref:Uncharacterized protein n=1 Tax=Artomyces pyxidatus TaxID=48021 RepID=A0ACB8T6P4_9AGAM|nr:hypothetical protein BV25DRAFT_1906838 [Artomyces pyxidatus]